MAPRAKATTETVEPTRRSSRISAQPKVDVVAKEPAAKKAAPKASKKRAADESEGVEGGDDKAPTVKKARIIEISKPG